MFRGFLNTVGLSAAEEKDQPKEETGEESWSAYGSRLLQQYYPGGVADTGQPSAVAEQAEEASEEAVVPPPPAASPPVAIPQAAVVGTEGGTSASRSGGSSVFGNLLDSLGWATAPSSPAVAAVGFLVVFPVVRATASRMTARVKL